MKYHKKRRFGALVLALAMALSLAAPVWAADESVSISPKPTELKVDETSAELTATVSNGPAGGTAITYKWTCNPEKAVDFSNDRANKTTITGKNITNSAEIKVTVTWQTDPDDESTKVSLEDKFTVEVKEASTSTPVAVTGVKLNKDTLTVEKGKSGTLTATVEPNDATNKKVTWKSSDEKIATVDDQGNVTGVGVGKATITVTTEDGNKTATCAVEVTDADSSTSPAPGSPADTVIFGESPIVWDVSQPNPWTLTVSPGPAGCKMQEGDKIEWSVSNKDTTMNTEEFLPALTVKGEGLSVGVSNKYPGEYIFSATYVKADGTKSKAVTKDATISGITLNKSKVEMTLDKTDALAVDKSYGMATGGTVRDIVWTSSDPAIRSVTLRALDSKGV